MLKLMSKKIFTILRSKILFIYACVYIYLRNEFNFWASLTLQETQSIHDSMNISKIEFIA